MKSRATTVLLVIVFILGLCIMAYPPVSNYWNKYHTTRMIADYTDAIAEMDYSVYEAMIEAAEEWNAERAENQTGLYLSDAEYEEYEQLLQVTKSGIMGYIDIEKIDVELPIYHGTSAGVLQVATGHLSGTSLPVGGESSHCVISGHRGLPSAMLFTDLDEMEIGDTFELTVLNETYTYEVDQISIIEPEDTESLFIVEGEDYCTLLMCTPYGINTHRLLVRGVRIETTGTHVRVINEAVKVTSVLVAAVIAAPMLVILLIVMLATTRRRKR
ncbi:MAG: class C sortase [Clostridia bacterium]|nr:class C sortase [Clostridia bacterium]